MGYGYGLGIVCCAVSMPGCQATTWLLRCDHSTQANVHAHSRGHDLIWDLCSTLTARDRCLSPVASGQSALSLPSSGGGRRNGRSLDGASSTVHQLPWQPLWHNHCVSWRALLMSANSRHLTHSLTLSEERGGMGRNVNIYDTYLAERFYLWSPHILSITIRMLSSS